MKNTVPTSQRLISRRIIWVIISFLPVALLPVLGNLGFANSTFSDADFGIAGIFLGKVQEFVGGTGLTIVLLGIFAIMVALTILTKKKIETAQTEENKAS